MESTLGRLHERAQGRSVGEGENVSREDELEMSRAIRNDDVDRVNGGRAKTQTRKRKSRATKNKPPPEDGVSEDSMDEDDEYVVPPKSRRKGKGAARGRAKATAV